MFCKYCGAENKDGARFCGRCGKEILQKIDTDDLTLDDAPAVPPEEVKEVMSEEELPEIKTEEIEDVIYGELSSEEIESEAKRDYTQVPANEAYESLEPVKKKKSKAPVIITLILILLIAAAGGTIGGMKYFEYKKERKLAEEQKAYDEYIKKLNVSVEAAADGISSFILDDEKKKEYDGLLKSLTQGIKLKEEQTVLEEKNTKLAAFIDELGKANKAELTSKIENTKADNEKLKNNKESFAEKADYDEIESNIAKAASLTEEGKYAEADGILSETNAKIALFAKLPDNYTVNIQDFDLRSFPTVKMYVSVYNAGEAVDGLSSTSFVVATEREVNGEFDRDNDLKAAVTGKCRDYGNGGVYELEFNVKEPENIEKPCYVNVYAVDGEGNGGYEKGHKFSMTDLCEKMYGEFQQAEYNCQTMGETALLDSGLILTTDKAYSEKKYIARQSSDSIKAGSMGSDTSQDSYEIVDYRVIDVKKDGKGFIVWGYAKYHIYQHRKYNDIKNKEAKEMARNNFTYYDDEEFEEYYGDEEFLIEKITGNYEKLKLVKDTDGVWKFSTREYERQDGGTPWPTHEILSVTPSSY